MGAFDIGSRLILGFCSGFLRSGGWSKSSSSSSSANELKHESSNLRFLVDLIGFLGPSILSRGDRAVSQNELLSLIP